MTRNQLPEGVGKKIVEALKRQAEADITPLEETQVSVSTSVPLTEIEDLPEVQYEPITENIESNDDFIVEEETPKINFVEQSVEKEVPKMEEVPQMPFIEQPQIQTPIQQQIKPQQSVISQHIVNDIQKPAIYSTPLLNQESINKSVVTSSNKISMPANVSTIKSLINSLPVGVTKQTGAQIIRQTLEAMGLPMNSVLKEAQMFQEELNSSTRECMIKIQEYKTQIMQLERSVQEYQQNVNQVNDIVSLFLLTDKQ